MRPFAMWSKQNVYLVEFNTPLKLAAGDHTRIMGAYGRMPMAPCYKLDERAKEGQQFGYLTLIAKQVPV